MVTVTPSCHSESFHIHVKLCYNISCLSSQFQNDPKFAVSKFWHKWRQWGLLFSVLSRRYVELGFLDPTKVGVKHHTATPLIVSHWSLTEAADWTRKWQVNHPMITQLFLRVGPKDPTHCNAAGPQESWSPCWKTREPKDWFKSKDLPLRRQQHSLPSFHKLSPSCEGLHSTCKSKFENLHELVCEVSIRNTYPSCPVFWVFRAQVSIVSHIPFSRFSHLLANGLKACSPLGPRLQCLTLGARQQEFQVDSNIIDQYRSSITYYKYLPRKTSSSKFTCWSQMFIPMLSLLL